MEVEEQRYGFYVFGLISALLLLLLMGVITIVLVLFSGGAVLLPVLLATALLMGLIVFGIFRRQRREASSRRQAAEALQEFNRNNDIMSKASAVVQLRPREPRMNHPDNTQRSSWYDFVPWNASSGPGDVRSNVRGEATL